ncbi:unnamed protein product [Rhizophagus irregularis]|nr:unnamed protein product [Rhizophagus irregularis]
MIGGSSIMMNRIIVWRVKTFKPSGCCLQIIGNAQTSTTKFLISSSFQLPFIAKCSINLLTQSYRNSLGFQICNVIF